jgi:sulfite reductase (NADPH) hemoprotein beta-component
MPGWALRTALREIAEMHTGDFRITTSQNLTISGVTPEQKPKIEAILAKHGLVNENERSGLRLNSLSCVALPTCGLALAESERVLPSAIEKFEAVLAEAGLSDQPISLRITGCPNGCARPYLAEIAFSGRAPNKYALYIGASYNGTRLNRLLSPSITIDDGVKLLTPIIHRYVAERLPGEGFGDFCHRAVLPADATLHSVGTPTPAPEAAPVLA